MTKKFFILLFLCVTSALHAVNYLTFTAKEDGSSFGIDIIKKYLYEEDSSSAIPDVQYSLDGGKTWAKLPTDTFISLKRKGDKALLRGNNPQGFSNSTKLYTKFVMTGRIAASGSVMSLIDNVGESVVFPNECCFNALFARCTSLTKAPELPATKLTDECYEGMFYGCTSLTKAPKLPATTLAFRCYRFMFYGCTSLTTAPELPATTLAFLCYRRMFYGCTSLTKAPELPATTLDKYCYESMFYGCTSLTKVPELPATILEEGCYKEMFDGCTSLTKVPELPATELEPFCYMRMFKGCVRLSKIKVGFLDWGEIFDVRGDKFWNTDHWFDGVAPSGTFICPEELPEEFGENRIPEGWKVEKVKN